MSAKYLTRIFGAVMIIMVAAACDSPEEQIEAYYESGKELLDNGEYTKAGLEFRNALTINEDHVPSLLGLSRVAENERNYRFTAQLLRKVVDIEPDNLEANVRFGQFMVLAQNLDVALEYSNKALELAPDDAGVQALRASILLQLEDTAGALEAARRSLELDPNNPDAISVLAAERIAAEDYEAAIARLDEVLKDEPEQLALQLMKLRALERMQDLDATEQSLNEIVATFPDNKQLRMGRVRFYLETGRADEAEADFRAMLEEEPDNFELASDFLDFIEQVRGTEAAGEELQRFIARGGEQEFEFQMLFVDYLRNTGDFEQAERLLSDLSENAPELDQRVRAKSEYASILLVQGKAEAARTAAEEVLEDDAANIGAQVVIGSILLAEDKINDALIALRLALREDPNSVRALILLGIAHERQGALELAEAQYNRAFEASNGSAVVGLPFARFLMRQDEMDRAAEVVSEVIRSNPRDREAYRLIAEIFLEQRDWDRAKQVATVLRNLEEDEAVVGQIEGLALLGEENVEASVEAFERAQSAAPNAVRPMASLVQAYLRTGDSDRARDFLQNVIASSPENWFAYTLLGDVHALRDEDDAARESFDKAMELNPQSELVHISYYRYLSREDQRQEALDVLRHGRENVPQSVLIGLTLASELERDQDFEAALAIYEEMYDLAPNSIVVINNYVSTLTQLREDRDTAVRAMEIAEPLMSIDAPQLQDTIGWLQYRLGNHRQAASLLAQASEGLPDLAVVRYHRGMNYAALENWDDAVRQLEMSVELAEQTPFAKLDAAKAKLAELRSAQPSGANQ